MNNILLIIVLLSAVGSGIMAGLFFIFSNTAMSAFSRLTPAQGISAMQSINRVILNPVFFLAFIGTAVLSVLNIIFLIWDWSGESAILSLIGAVVYIVGSFLVTVVFNVPMNNRLDKVGADTAEGEAVWNDYLVNWTKWNHVRTLSCIVSMVLFILAFKYL